MSSKKLKFKVGFKAGKTSTIQRACEWLDKNACRYIVTRPVKGLEMTGLDASMTEDFRKAMEE